MASTNDLNSYQVEALDKLKHELLNTYQGAALDFSLVPLEKKLTRVEAYDPFTGILQFVATLGMYGKVTPHEGNLLNLPSKKCPPPKAKAVGTKPQRSKAYQAMVEEARKDTQALLSRIDNTNGADLSELLSEARTQLEALTAIL